MTARRYFWSFCVAAMALALNVRAEEDNGFKLQLSDWSYGRIRKTVTSSNRVIANMTAKNTCGAPIRNVNIVIQYTVASGEKAAEPVKKLLGDFKPGESRKLEVIGDFIPAFESYDITVTYDGISGAGKEQWYSSSDSGQPQAKNAEPIKGIADLVILGRDGGVDRSGRFNGNLRVKNNGTADAKNVKFVLTFFDDKKKKIAEVTDRLGDGTFRGGIEQLIPFSAPNCPKVAGSYVIKVVCDETPPEAADFSGIADVEFAKFSFKRDPKTQDVKATAEVRNGFDVPVEKATVILSFTNAKKEVKSFTYEVPGKLNAGEVRPLDFKIPGVPVYESFEQKISYLKLSKDGPAAPAAVAEAPTKVEAPKFKDIADVEVIFTSASNNEDKSVLLIGAMRNGRATPVKDVAITVTFALPDGKTLDGQKTLSDVIQPGEQRNFVLKTPAATGYKEYNYKFTSVDVK